MNILHIIIIFSILMTVYTIIYFFVKMLFYFDKIFVIPIYIMLINTSFSVFIYTKTCASNTKPKTALPIQAFSVLIKVNEIIVVIFKLDI